MVSRETRIGQLFVELADTLTDDFDLVEFMHQLVDACIELLDVDMAGLMLTDLNGRPRLVASSLGAMRDLELFELQANEGPCLDVIENGRAVVNVQVTDVPATLAPLHRGSTAGGDAVDARPAAEAALSPSRHGQPLQQARIAPLPQRHRPGAGTR